MQRYANPKRGRVFLVAGVQRRLVLPSVARTGGRWTTAAWVSVWKLAYAELADGRLPKPIEPTPAPTHIPSSRAATEPTALPTPPHVPPANTPFSGPHFTRPGRSRQHLTPCERDVLRFLLLHHPQRWTGEAIHDELDRRGWLHGLTTVRLALAKLRNSLRLLVNPIDHEGYGLSDAGLAEARAISAEEQTRAPSGAA
jgi:hypothetical protein